MKALFAILVLAAVVNLLAWMFVEAWDKEETLRVQRNKQYIQMLRDEGAANERSR